MRRFIVFNNIGKKIKGLSKFICWIGIISSIITAIVMFLLAWDWGYTEYTIIGVVVLIVGSLLSWISSFFSYGFGELIDKVCDIERNTRGGERKSEAQIKVDMERINKLERLRSQGLITEEEYQQAVSKN